MSKYKRYIFFYICEVSYSNFKFSNFSTHINYCKILNKKLNESNLSSVDTIHIYNIFNLLDKVFSIDKEESIRYILEFYSLDTEQILLFENAVKLNRVFYFDL